MIKLFDIQLNKSIFIWLAEERSWSRFLELCSKEAVATLKDGLTS